MFFFFNDTATTEIYPLSLHDALPISSEREQSETVDRQNGTPAVAAPRAACTSPRRRYMPAMPTGPRMTGSDCSAPKRSEEHTSELQSQSNLVCRLLLEKKKKKHTYKI